MSTHNICFFEDLTKLSFNYHQIRTLSLLMTIMICDLNHGSYPEKIYMLPLDDHK